MGFSSFLCEVVRFLVVVEVDATGERDRECVYCLSPSLGSGAKFIAAVVADVADCQVKDSEDDVVYREVASSFCDLA